MSDGLCGCGCGQATLVAPRTSTTRGWVRGEPLRFLHRHFIPVRVQPRVPLAERVWRHIEPEPNSGCWLWIGHITEDGYGAVGEGGRSLLVHRVLYALLVGPIPPDRELDHLCRVRRCGNPRHVEPVTGVVNVRRGCRTKLTVESAAEIRRLVAGGGKRQVDIAARFGVPQTQISRIARGEAWR